MPPEGERSLHSAIRATRWRRNARRKSRGAGDAATDSGRPASTPLALSAAIAARRDSRMRSRMGAAFVAISRCPPSRSGAGCGLLQDSLHPLDALLDLIDRVRIREPQIALPHLAERAPGEQGDPAFVEHPVGQLALVLSG